MKVGSYEISLDPRGIRLARPKDNPPNVVRPLIAFALHEPGKAPTPFTMQRMLPAGNDSVEFHGYMTQRIALDGVIKYSPATDGLSIELRVENASEEMQVRISAQLQLSGEADPRWLVPGFFYADNKPPGCTRLYPCFSEINRDPRRLTSSYWAIRSDRAAMPLACAWTYGAFAFISTHGMFGRSKELPQGIGMSGLYFGSEDGQPAVGVEFPYREAPAKFSFCHEDKTEPEETFMLLPERTPLTSNFTVGYGAADLHAYARVVRGLYGELAQAYPPRAKMPPEVAEQMAHTGLLRWHYDARQAAIFESATFDRHFSRKGTYLERPHMHAGWLSGALPAYALLWAGRESNHLDSITAGTAVLNKFSGQLSPAGTIFPVWTEEHGWSSSFGPDEGTAHSRTIAEAVLFLVRALSLELRYNTTHQQWLEAVMSSLNYAMGSQRADGALPAYFDLTTGRPTSYDGCGGLAWIAALAAAAGMLQAPHFKEVAVRAGEYYANFVRKGLVYGSVEDQPLVPTSDDAHWALISFMQLYELDRDARWLDLARKSADLALTWRFAYNVSFAPESMLARYDFRTRGGDISSVATPTLGAQGLISYRELLKLAAYTGDDYYRQRAEDGRLFATQLVAREDGDLNARAGMVAGQVFYTDWYQPKGVMLTLSNAMCAGLTKYAELTRRHLKITAKTFEASKSMDFEKELGPQSVSYADVAMREEEVAASTGAGLRASSMDIPTSLGLTTSIGEALGISTAPRRSSPQVALPREAPAAPSGPAAPRDPLGVGRTQPLPPAASGSFGLGDLPTSGGIVREQRRPNDSRANESRSDARPIGGGFAQPERTSTGLSNDSVDISKALTGIMGSALGLGQPPSRGRSTRGLSTDQVPVPDLQGPAPIAVPPSYEDIIPPTGGASGDKNRKPPVSSDEVEIKYKIF